MFLSIQNMPKMSIELSIKMSIKWTASSRPLLFVLFQVVLLIFTALSTFQFLFCRYFFNVATIDIGDIGKFINLLGVTTIVL